MPNITLKKIIFNFELLSADNKPVSDLVVTMQYFDGNNDAWVSLAESTIKSGKLNLALKPPVAFNATRAINTVVSIFWDKANSNMLPNMRIIPKIKVLNTSKQEVLASTFESSVNKRSKLLNINFGKTWMLNNKAIKKIDHYKNFIPISSHFPITNKVEDTSAISALNTKIRKYSDDNKILLREKNDLNRQKNELKLNLDSLENDKNLLINENKIKENRINEINKQLRDDNKKMATLTTTNKGLLKEIDTLQDQLAELANNRNWDETPISINSFCSNIVNEIDKADSRKAESKYKLTNISMKLKALVNADSNNAVNVQLISPDKMKDMDSDALSEINFNVSAQNERDTDSLTMPNLSGLTETAVRKQLSRIGARLNPVYQSNIEVSNGASFKQSPQAGSSINQNETVTVIFSKNE
jgi:hypothetical protein